MYVHTNLLVPFTMEIHTLVTTQRQNVTKIKYSEIQKAF